MRWRFSNALLCGAGHRIGRYALNGTVETHHFAIGPNDVDVIVYVFNIVDDIRQVLDSAIQRHASIKYYATMDVQFYRTTTDGRIQQTTAPFCTSPGVLSDATSINIDGIAR